MNIKTKFIIRALVGFSLGISIGAITYVIFTSETEPLNKRFLLMQLFGSGLYGAIANGGAIVYDFESWSLGRATLTHYLVTFVSMFITSKILGWFPQGILFWVFLAFSIVYLAIWLTEYYLWKKEIAKINGQLELVKFSSNIPT
ncbi:Protein of unknown function [Oribacterium sp. KHPX15]|uniref:DUF3021 domain-containing protein n=1 Tax=unclassified Oribacterium TaxID=2629782 RepID=UPI0006792285|nr:MULTISPECIES: DUF3021 domain-containing protein [unclassified Oribacterium]SDZ86637.1 Protein of unknown function [Oribacterium sp. KHPX15]